MSTSSTDVEAVLTWVRARTGLEFEGCHRDRMAATVRRAWADAGASSREEYLGVLASDPVAFEALTDRLTVGESYFFREPDHFRLLRDRVAALRPRTSTRAIRVWSAGCAGGEEPYSVAIALDELGLLARAEIIATDLSERAVRRASAAVYGDWSLRRCDDEDRRRWFDPHGSRWRLHDRYREAVTLRTASLLDGPPGGAFDVVLCRNVLLYLSPEALQGAATVLHDALAPDGWLLVGASDPPLHHPGLALCVGDHGVAYRRSGTEEATSASGSGPAARAPEPRAAVLDPVRVVRSHRRPEAARAPKRHRPVESPPVGVGDALARLSAAVDHLDAGRHDDAAREASAARYLDPDLVGAHLVLAHVAEVAGDVRRARRSYRQAVRLLVALPPTDEVTPLGEQAGQLLDALQRRLAHDEVGR